MEKKLIFYVINERVADMGELVIGTAEFRMGTKGIIGLARRRRLGVTN